MTIRKICFVLLHLVWAGQGQAAHSQNQRSPRPHFASSPEFDPSAVLSMLLLELRAAAAFHPGGEGRVPIMLQKHGGSVARYAKGHQVRMSDELPVSRRSAVSTGLLASALAAGLFELAPEAAHAISGCLGANCVDTGPGRKMTADDEARDKAIADRKEELKQKWRKEINVFSATETTEEQSASLNRMVRLIYEKEKKKGEIPDWDVRSRLDLVVKEMRLKGEAKKDYKEVRELLEELYNPMAEKADGYL